MHTHLLYEKKQNAAESIANKFTTITIIFISFRVIK